MAVPVTARVAWWAALGLATILGLKFWPALGAQEPQPTPILRIDAGGHTSTVTSVAWHPGSRQFWSAGWDKTVRCWKADDRGRFAPYPDAHVRWPIGPGRSGQMDALALSSDGRWMVVAGYSSLQSRAASFGESGFETKISSIELLEQGTIYLIDRQSDSVARLEGHRGPVWNAVFAKSHDGTDWLVTVGFDQDATQKTVGSIRVWDIGQAKLARHVLLPESPRTRPSVVASPDSTAPRDLNILVATGTAGIYHWRSSQSDSPNRLADVDINNALLRDPRSGRLLSLGASNATNQGQISFWQEPSGSGPPSRISGSRIAFDRVGSEIFLPQAATLLPSGEPENSLLAVALLVIRVDGTGKAVAADRIELRVLRISHSSTTASREIVKTKLWSLDRSGIRVPALVPSPDGQYLIAAGAAAHELVVFQVEPLSKGTLRTQRLASDAARVTQLSFAQKESNLALSMQMESQEGTSARRLFDLSSSRFAAPDGWTNRPATANWSVAPRRDNPTVVDLSRPGANRISLQLPPRHTLDQYVVAESTQASKKGWVALAARETGQPWLGIFELSSGTLLRVLNAHSEMITSLAVGQDHRLLASASNDRTVAIWDMSDVEVLFQPRSKLPDVSLIDRDGKVVVDQVRGTSMLRSGDVLLGFTTSAAMRSLTTWSSVADVQASLLAMPKGSSIQIRYNRNGSNAEASITTAALADLRGPLFQFTAFLPSPVAPPRWIGWSPLGPFDASDQETQGRLGWLFNARQAPGLPGYAPIDQYARLYQPGLVTRLVNELGRAPIKQTRSQSSPRMRLSIDDPVVERWSESGSARVRKPLRSISVAIENGDEFARDRVREVQLWDGERSLGLLRSVSSNQWQSGDGMPEDWARGSHTLRARLLTEESTPRSFEVAQEWEFLPDRPQLRWEEALPKETLQPSVPVAYHVTAFAPGQAVLARRADDGQETVLQRWSVSTGEQVLRAQVQLQPGHNALVFTQTNEGATRATLERETSSLSGSVYKKEPDRSPPQIELVRMRISDTPGIPGAPSDGMLPKPSEGQPWLVDQEQVAVGGRIRAEEPLTVATLNGDTIPGWTQGQSKSVDFEFPVSLRPGDNRMLIRSKTYLSEPTVLEIPVRLTQAIPQLQIVMPVDGQVLSSRVAGQRAAFKATFQPLKRQRPLSIDLHVNQNPITDAITVDWKQGLISGHIPIRIGLNTLVLHSQNDLGDQSQDSPLQFYYHPVPRLIDRQVPKEIETSIYKVVLRGETDAPIERLVLDDAELPRDAWKGTTAAGRFAVELQLPWVADQRESVVALYATGIPTPAFATISTPARRTPGQPPRLAFLSPSEDGSLGTGQVTLQLMVQSESGLQKVQLLHDGLEVPMHLDLKADGELHVRKEVPVQLNPGINEFRWVAANRDGSRSQVLRLNYVVSPVRIHLDQLVPTAGGEANPLAIQIHSEGKWVVSGPAVASRMTLHGRIVWNHHDRSDKAEAPMLVWAAVNGFKQTARLLPAEPGARERPFAVDLCLFDRDRNAIEVSVADVPELAGRAAAFEIACSSPEVLRQRLHFVLVGVGVDAQDRPKLLQDAVQSLSGTNLVADDDRNIFTFQSPVFAKCYGYGPYTGSVVRLGSINSILQLVRRTIERFPKDDPANDLLLIYYRGGEQVYDRGEFYLTTQIPGNEQEAALLRDPELLRCSALSSRFLAEMVQRFPGSQVLMLDVARMSADPNRSEPDTGAYRISDAAVLRYAWLKGPQVPNEARLLAAWKNASDATRLGQVDTALQRQHQSLLSLFPKAIGYETFVPDVLKSLLMKP